ncbi:MAG: septum site-determining protein MinC [Thiohalocapsa sp.]
MSAQLPPPIPGLDSAGPSASNSVDGPVLELKAAAFTLPVIRLLGLDMDAVETQLAPKVEQAPGFFRNTPVVIDLAALSASDADVGFPQLVGLLRGLGMIPVGVRGGSPSQQEAAMGMELAILADVNKPRQRLVAGVFDASEAREPVPAEASKPNASPRQDDAPASMDTHEYNGGGSSTLIDRPVRSGQRVYVPGGDLTVVAAVSSGAELMADGNIHIYAPMRGRAIAGLKGDTEARIFCQDLQAELISVAGHYRVSENIPAELKGKCVQVFLDHEVLRIEPL